MLVIRHVCKRLDLKDSLLEWFKGMVAQYKFFWTGNYKGLAGQQNIWNKLKKLSKVRQEQKNLTTASV